jgi:hypothetical protein
MGLSFGWRKALTGAVWVTLITLAVVNLLLLRQNQRMRRALNEITRAKAGPAEGERLEPFNARALDGDAINVNYYGKGAKRVFIFFSPSCVFSNAQFAYWRRLLERVDRNRFEVIGLASEVEDAETLRRYLNQLGFEAPPQHFRVALLPDAVRRTYKLSVTPTTLVVTNDGTVEKVWQGQWGLAEVNDARAVFDSDLSATTPPREPAGEARSAKALTASHRTDDGRAGSRGPARASAFRSPRRPRSEPAGLQPKPQSPTIRG